MNLLQVVYDFEQHNDKNNIFKTWIIVDTCSMAIVNNNRDLLMNVQAYYKKNVLEIVTNSGS